jgi:hypothetical protein
VKELVRSKRCHRFGKRLGHLRSIDDVQFHGSYTLI